MAHPDSNPPNCLIVFAKQPIVGQVKTRLAKAIGEANALEVYRKLLAFTEVQVKMTRAFSYLYTDEGSILPGWRVDQVRKQADGELGNRLEVAFGEVWEEQARYCKMVVIGTDCPELTADLIEGAFELLNRFDVVIGPAVDGGYYLLGTKTLQGELFREKSWSQPTLLLETLRTAIGLRLTVATLPVLYDLDEPEDLERFPAFR